MWWGGSGEQPRGEGHRGPRIDTERLHHLGQTAAILGTLVSPPVKQK